MDASDDNAARLIIEKLKQTIAVAPFAEIARAARAIGRNRLAALVRYFFIVYCIACVCVCTQIMYIYIYVYIYHVSHILHVFLKLLDHEVHAKDQVPLLMDMKKADAALDKAIESGDPQLGMNDC